MKIFFYSAIVAFVSIFGIIAKGKLDIEGINSISQLEREYSPPRWCDTLRLEDGTKYIFFITTTPPPYSTTFLSFFDGYAELFKDNENMILWMGSKGYTCNWVVKDGRIYLEEILFQYAEGTPPSIKEGQEKIEELTGEKFNSDGLLPANWISGAFNVYRAVPTSEPYRFPSVIDWGKRYVFHFEKGELISIDVTESE
jgi:hypothetical protein